MSLIVGVISVYYLIMSVECRREPVRAAPLHEMFTDQIVKAYDPERLAYDIAILIDQSAEMQKSHDHLLEMMRHRIRRYPIGQGENETSFAVLLCREGSQPSLLFHDNKTFDEITRYIEFKGDGDKKQSFEECLQLAMESIFQPKNGDRILPKIYQCNETRDLIIYLTACGKSFKLPKHEGLRVVALCFDLNVESDKASRYHDWTGHEMNKDEIFSMNFDDHELDLFLDDLLGVPTVVSPCVCDFEYGCSYQVSSEKCEPVRWCVPPWIRNASHRQAKQCLQKPETFSNEMAPKYNCSETDCECDEDSYRASECSVTCGTGMKRKVTKNIMCDDKEIEKPCTINLNCDQTKPGDDDRDDIPTKPLESKPKSNKSIELISTFPPPPLLPLWSPNASPNAVVQDKPFFGKWETDWLISGGVIGTVLIVMIIVVVIMIIRKERQTEYEKAFQPVLPEVVKKAAPLPPVSGKESSETSSQNESSSGYTKSDH